MSKKVLIIEASIEDAIDALKSVQSRMHIFVSSPELTQAQIAADRVIEAMSGKSKFSKKDTESISAVVMQVKTSIENIKRLERASQHELHRNAIRSLSGLFCTPADEPEEIEDIPKPVEPPMIDMETGVIINDETFGEIRETVSQDGADTLIQSGEVQLDKSEEIEDIPQLDDAEGPGDISATLISDDENSIVD